METTWQLGEAVFTHDAPSAIRIGRSQLSSDTPLIPLLRQLRSQFQTEFQVCTLLLRGASPSDITQEFPYMRGAILDRHIKQARGYGLERFKEGILAIDKAEMEAKNSSMDPEFIFDVLMVKLTT
jgi:DNA polymerase-3 subunit delta